MSTNILGRFTAMRSMLITASAKNTAVRNAACINGDNLNDSKTAIFKTAPKKMLFR